MITLTELEKAVDALTYALAEYQGNRTMKNYKNLARAVAWADKEFKRKHIVWEPT